MSGITNNKWLLLSMSLLVILGISACKTPASLSEIPLEKYEWYNTSIKDVPAELSADSGKHLHYTDFYSDPFLIELIEIGLENNLDLKVLQRRVNQAQESYELSKKSWLPALNAGLNGSFSAFPTNENLSEWGKASNWDLGLSTGAWEIDIWGKLKYLRNAKEAQLIQMQLTERQLKNTLIAQIAQSYYQLIASRESLRITEETIVNWEHTVETMKALKIAGRVTEAAVTQSVAQLAAIETTLSALRSSVLAAEQQINYLLGRAQQPIQTRSIEADQKLPLVDIGIPSDLLILRPDLRIAYERVREAFFEKEAAKTYFLPSLTLSGKLGFQANDFKDIINPLSLIGNIAGGMLQPIFQKGVNKARLNIATEEELAMLDELESTYINACMEVEELLYSYQQELIKKEYRGKQIQQSKLSVEYTEELLESGFAIYTEVITAKQQQLQAELGGINGFIIRQRLLIQLFNAVGGGI